MSNNNEANGIAIAIGVFAAGMVVFGAFVFAVGLFLSMLMTLWCLYAWNKPRTLFGETTTPKEARNFVYRGLAGMVILPVFITFAAALFGIRVRDDWWGYFTLAGYVLGSLGIGILIEKHKAEAAQQQAMMQALLPDPAQTARTIESRPSITPVSDAQPEAEPFRFATWDDEEELRK